MENDWRCILYNVNIDFFVVLLFSNVYNKHVFCNKKRKYLIFNI